jgi:hypothetical protein
VTARLVTARQASASRPTAISAAAADTAEAYVRAYCSRGLPDPPPEVACRIAEALAVRLSANPQAQRALSVEGQSLTLAPVGFTYKESLLLNRWRRRAA